jgi:hypothetical protein
MVHIKNKIILSLIIIFFVISNCIAHINIHRKGGIKCCIENQLKLIGKVKTIPKLLKGSCSYKTNDYIIKVDNDSLFLSGKLTKMNFSKIDSIKAWIEVIVIQSLKVYSLSSKKKNYFLLSSKAIGATGLAINFYQWLIIDASSQTAITTSLLSLSDDARMFYIRNDLLNINIFEFGDDFYFKERDWNNPPIKITTYEVKDYTLLKTKQLETFCNCN